MKVLRMSYIYLLCFVIILVLIGCNSSVQATATNNKDLSFEKAIQALKKSGKVTPKTIFIGGVLQEGNVAHIFFKEEGDPEYASDEAIFYKYNDGKWSLFGTRSNGGTYIKNIPVE